ncbi:hypothetical protein NA78x_003709 [Anatilimnocola sp. NA78]|uniref:hypothetical protein n=1 Tax=Anatilimnocola sp. NA78 TaxID=3415683 RepID=UPI003CE5012E
MKLQIAFRLCCLACCLPVLTGCASWQAKIFGSQPDAAPAPTFEERKAVAVQSYEQKREAASIQAAVALWQRGEGDKCESQLAAIIAHNPKCVPAKLRMAEVLAAQNESSAAETQLRECLTIVPDNAEAHHALGMLLSDWPGREAEGTSMLKRACELEPNNEVYAAMLQTEQ